MAPRLSERLSEREDALVQEAIAYSIADAAVPRPSETSDAHSDATDDDANPPALKDVPAETEGNDATEQGAQSRRAAPKRAVAIKSEGYYRVKRELSADEAGHQAGHQAAVEPVFERSAKRQRLRAPARRQKGSNALAAPSSDHQADAGTPRRTRQSDKSASSTPSMRTMRPRASQATNSQAVLVIDDNEDDEDFAPDGRRSRGKQTPVKKEVDAASPNKSGNEVKRFRITGDFSNAYKIRLGTTPFPNNTRPYPRTCQAVFDILKKYHEDEVRLERYPKEDKDLATDDVQGPMHAGQEVTFSAILKTVLSQATGNVSALNVEKALVERFQYDFLGIKVKGTTPNFHAMRKTPRAVIANILAPGGLHMVKSKLIKQSLDYVYQYNWERASPEERVQAEQTGEAFDFEPGMLSLDYMNSMSTQEKFDHLVGMGGIGVKTAACILCFNYEMPVFAVDTHVFRLARMLRWLPVGTKSADRAFMHLDKRVPDELKYGLHQAFWWHGQRCYRCQARTSKNKSKEWNDSSCPLEHLMDRRQKGVPGGAKRSRKVAEKTEGVKRKPHMLPHAKMTADKAKAEGYELRAITVDDGFGVRRSNVAAQPLLKWVLKTDEAAMEQTDRKATVEDIEQELEDAEDVEEDADDEAVPDDEVDDDDDDDDNVVVEDSGSEYDGE